MFSPSWFRRTNHNPGAACAAARRQPRLGVENLEDRSLLSTYTAGPLVLVSNPDPLADCPPGLLGADVAAEPYVAVNPANPKNIAAIWIDQWRRGQCRRSDVSTAAGRGRTWPSRGSRSARAAPRRECSTPGSASAPPGICTPSAAPG